MTYSPLLRRYNSSYSLQHIDKYNSYHEGEIVSSSKTLSNKILQMKRKTSEKMKTREFIQLFAMKAKMLNARITLPLFIFLICLMLPMLLIFPVSGSIFKVPCRK